MTKALFVAWQDPESRRWIPVGRLTFENGTYRFTYTRGAKEAKSFVPFGRMTDFNSAYVSNELFPLFANRILPKSRPEYGDYLRWLGLTEARAQELEVLARSGGLRATDTLEIFPCPEPTDDHRYVVYFFSHGVRYLLPENHARFHSLQQGERLYLMKDIQNSADAMALLLRTGDPVSNVGYCPRYYCAEFGHLIDVVGAEKVIVTVERVNPDAPMQFRLLCRLSAPWPANFAPCSMEEFQALPEAVETA